MQGGTHSEAQQLPAFEFLLRFSRLSFEVREPVVYVLKILDDGNSDIVDSLMVSRCRL